MSSAALVIPAATCSRGTAGGWNCAPRQACAHTLALLQPHTPSRRGALTQPHQHDGEAQASKRKPHARGGRRPRCVRRRRGNSDINQRCKFRRALQLVKSGSDAPPWPLGWTRASSGLGARGGQSERVGVQPHAPRARHGAACEQRALSVLSAFSLPCAEFHPCARDLAVPV